jgi:hypothetical protein
MSSSYTIHVRPVAEVAAEQFVGDLATVIGGAGSR